uniref:Uncharacterized protein dc12 n=1 Tax=Synechococcus elongatus (strain ATCC 33912 / PCC 7942 / FACHB-805) TaxID=1140 RepID=P72545_SYNE7|nr:putative protein [Synechococcus elongatus PCC 7942 = FACHB-805]
MLLLIGQMLQHIVVNHHPALASGGSGEFLLQPVELRAIDSPPMQLMARFIKSDRIQRKQIEIRCDRAAIVGAIAREAKVLIELDKLGHTGAIAIARCGGHIVVARHHIDRIGQLAQLLQQPLMVFPLPVLG